MSSLDSALAEGGVAPSAQPATISPARVAFFAAVVGVFIFNVFANQVVLGPIATSLGLSQASWVSTATLLGYALGLLLVVPLADVVENRRLVLVMALACVSSLALASVTTSGLLFLVLCVAIGASSSLIQVLVPLVGSLTPPEHRGRILGNVMSGLMLGIMASRPTASLVSDAWGWRALYAVSAVAIALVIIPLRMALPERRVATPIAYLTAIRSLGALLQNESVLRARSLTAALVMASFSAFWTAIAPRLTAAPFQLSARGIALFGIAGTAGAIAAPITGRLGDRGFTRPTTIVSDVLVVGAPLLALLGAGSLFASEPMFALGLMVLSAVILDFGVIGDQTLGRRAINLLDPSAMGRRNGLFVGIFFLGGAVGSATVGPVSAWAGFPGVCIAAVVFGLAALVVSAASNSK